MSALFEEIKDKVILISALDWGMGHITRMSAIIQQLKLNNTIIFAGNEAQNRFVSKEFPEIGTEDLKGYGIRLDSNKNTYFQMLSQLSKVKKAMRHERVWLENYINEHKVDLVVSDNRYGFYHSDVESIIVTHQLTLQVPQFKKLVSRRIQKMIAKFNAVWVPDNANQILTGELSDHQLKIPVTFIGSLNRFDFVKAANKIGKTYKYLIILSGPDPERLNFAMQMVEKYKHMQYEIPIVGPDTGFFDNYQNATTAELKELIEKSETVITRAGYTSIMELEGLGKKAILYPTNGQYEQAYLANYIKIDFLRFELFCD